MQLGHQYIFKCHFTCFFSMYVCMWVCVVCGCTQECLFGGQKSVSISVRLMKQVLSLNLELNSQPLSPRLLFPLGWDYSPGAIMPGLFLWGCWGFKLRSPRLHSNHFYQLSRFPSLQHWISQKSTLPDVLQVDTIIGYRLWDIVDIWNHLWLSGMS